MQKVHTEEIDERDILIDDQIGSPKFGQYGHLDDAALEKAQEMTPHSKAHREKRMDEAPMDADKVPHDPDGVDHSVVGMTALVAVMVAMLVAVLLITGGWVGGIGAVVIGLVALPLLVKSLAERDSTRDTTHHN